MAAIGHVIVQPHVGFEGKQRRHGSTKKVAGEKRVNKEDEIPERCSSKWWPLEPRRHMAQG